MADSQHILFERTDFPQRGWLDYVERNHYVHTSEFSAISQLAECYRNVRDRGQGQATLLFKRTDFPEQGWMADVVANSFTTASAIPAISQLVNSFRNVRDRSLYQDGERKIINGTNNGESPAPAEYGWYTHDDIARFVAQRAKSVIHGQEQPASDWMAFAANVFYDPTAMSGWLSSLGNFRSESSIRYQRDTNRDLAWAVSVQEQLVGWAAINQLAESFRNVRDKSLYGDGEKRPVQGSSASDAFIPEYDPQIDPWGIPSTRVPGKPYWTSAGPSVDWIENPVQQDTFDPATHSWTINSTYPRRTRPAQLSWTKSGFFVALFFNPAQQGWVVDSQLGPGFPYWTSASPTNEWISPETIAVFDPSQQSWAIQHQRVPGKPYYTSAWQGNDWLTPELLDEIAYDPRQADWTIQTSTYTSRAWYSDSPQQQAWMVPSVIFDIPFWPAVTIGSHRLWNAATGRWQPDLDQAWQTANPVVPHTFNPSFVTQSNELIEPGHWTPTGRTSEVIVFYVLDEDGFPILLENGLGYISQEEN